MNSIVLYKNEEARWLIVLAYLISVTLFCSGPLHFRMPKACRIAAFYRRKRR